MFIYKSALHMQLLPGMQFDVTDKFSINLHLNIANLRTCPKNPAILELIRGCCSGHSRDQRSRPVLQGADPKHQEVC
jgi:hypothetical protein